MKMDKKFFTGLIVFFVVSGIALGFVVKSAVPRNMSNTSKIQEEVRADEKTGITKTSDFFALSYNGVPKIDIEKYRLKVDGLVDNPLNLRYVDLKNEEQKIETETLTCVALVSAKGVWEGIPLKTILEKAGIKKGATYVVFYAEDGYSSAIPLQNALKDNVILALKLNGEILPAKHGFPLRLVYPGYYGYKWVKWINHIKVINYEYKGYWESRNYSNEAKIKKP